MAAHYRALPEQVGLFTVTAWGMHCPQHGRRWAVVQGGRAEALDQLDHRTAAGIVNG
jgi:hypothetical protein